MASKEIVSVIIPTYCEERNIARCLNSIKKQTYKDVEIVIVDQTSKDKTVEIAKKFTDKIIIREKPKFYSPPAKSRNMGAQIAKGHYLLNIDADMELPERLIENCVQTLKNHPEFSALIIHEKDIGLNFWARCRALEKDCTRKDPYMEAARFSRRSAFNAIGGYDATLGSGEDWDINARLKTVGKIGYCEIDLLHHTGKKKLFPNFKKMINYGKTFDRYIQKHPDLAKKQLTPFRKMYIRNWKLLAHHPIYTFGLGILKFTEFFGAFVGLVYMRFK